MKHAYLITTVPIKCLIKHYFWKLYIDMTSEGMYKTKTKI